jgi:methylated-DNA-[protein]-cysteine S-methyltransferase
MTTRHTIIDSPIGPLTLVATADDALAGIYLDGHLRRPALPPFAVAEPDGVLAAARDQLAEWFAGARVAFDLPLVPSATPFGALVRDALLAVPFGSTTTYGALAEAIGAPQAVRAVGSANARNPLSLVVPCHRVVGAGGGLTGYAGGVERKRWLLEHERAPALTAAAAAAAA